MKKYQVEVIEDAWNDIYDISQYVLGSDSVAKAEQLIDKIENLCFSLENIPERGHIAHELERLQISDYREIHYKSYRILYQIINNCVYIHRVLDGGRDIEQLLIKRLLQYERI